MKVCEFSDGLEALEISCFCNAALESVKIPASVRSVGPNAFAGCSGLVRVVFVSGSTLEEVGSRAFAGAALSGGVEFPAGAAVALDVFG